MVLANDVLQYLKYIKRYFNSEYGIMLTNKQCVSHCIHVSIDTVKGSVESNFAHIRISSMPCNNKNTIAIDRDDRIKLTKLQKQLVFIKVSLPFLLSVVIIEQGKVYMELCRLKGISLE